MKMTQVIFGGAMALYVDGKLVMMRRRIDYDDFIAYLLEHLHETFEPVQTITISDESRFWEIERDFISKQWTPDMKLEDLKKKLDKKTDLVY